MDGNTLASVLIIITVVFFGAFLFFGEKYQHYKKHKTTHN